VLFGQQAGGSEGAVLWAAVADRLRLPVVSQAAGVTHEDGKVKGKRQTEFGYDVIEAPLPAVVAVSDAINEPRYPSLKGIMGAKSKPQETVSASELGLDAGGLGAQGSRTSVLGLGARRPGASQRVVAPSPELEAPPPQPRVAALAQLVGEQGIATLLFAASVLASDVAAGLAARLDAGLNWDLVDIAAQNGTLVGKRPAL